MTVGAGSSQVAAPETPSGSFEPAIIATEGLTKKFGHQFAVKGVSLRVLPGTIFGFIGPSGSGKTTTIRMLTGVYKPTAGEVFVFGVAPTKFTKAIREKIGYMPQLFVLYPHLSIWENLNFAASVYGLSFFRKKRLKELLDFVELSEHKGKIVRNISGGMQRRLSLAATLVHEPELLFLDEPTAGIDPVLRNKFWDHFRELRDAGRTLFITTQYVSEAAYCDLVGVMGEGELLVVDSPKGLRYRAYGGDIVEFRASEPLKAAFEQMLPELPFVRNNVMRTGDKSIRLVVDEASTAIPALLDWCRDQNISIESIEEYLPPFDDVFVKLIQGYEEND